MAFLKTIKGVIKSCLKKVLYILPIQKKKIVFVNYDFKGYGDNPKYIAEEIIRQGLDCKLVWIVGGDYSIPSSIKKVYIKGVRWFYEMATAGFIITNRKGILLPNMYKKKDKQYFLQTWHGDFPLKYIEKEAEDFLPVGYVEASKADSMATNAIVSGNSQFSKILKDSFWLPEDCEILEYGVPRNDIYFRDDEFKNSLRQKYGFSVDDRILLYAPTFRDDGDTSCYNLDFERIRDVLRKRENKEWKVIVRLHPNVSNMAGMFTYNDSIINGTAFQDQQELCLISDCLITDYSSIMADFILMNKPVFLYATDFVRYTHVKNGRGLREVFFKLPFAINLNQEELEYSMTTYNYDDYLVKVKAFKREHYSYFDDGHASERIVNYLKKTVN